VIPTRVFQYHRASYFYIKFEDSPILTLVNKFRGTKAVALVKKKSGVLVEQARVLAPYYSVPGLLLSWPGESSIIFEMPNLTTSFIKQLDLGFAQFL